MGTESGSVGKKPVIFSRRREWATRQAISFLMQQGIENPQVLSLAAGFVDPQTLPVEEVRQAAEQVLVRSVPADCTAVWHHRRFRDASWDLTRHLAHLEHTTAEDLKLSHESLVLTTGSQQLLSLLCEVLLDPEDIVLVAAPTYFVFLGTLNGVGARIIPIPSDQDGMLVDQLEKTLAQLDALGELPRVKLIYVVSYYENPTGMCLAADRRPRVVELAKAWSKTHRILVLEDAAYRELRYDGPEYRSLWSYDQERDTVILAQTFSKSFCPGLRTGYGVVPQDLVTPLSDRKGNEDFGSAHLSQSLLSRVMQAGLYPGHVENLRAAYRRKREAMLQAIDEHFAEIPGVTWLRPNGGLYVWMTLPETVETGFHSELFRIATKQEKVMYVPGELFYGGPEQTWRKSQMRLSFGVLDEAGLAEGIQRLSRAVRQVIS
ncbi:MAG: PLP-dependent aminotransferase family protein [Planctomycetales bacterium]